jgi:hypothetical protein
MSFGSQNGETDAGVLDFLQIAQVIHSFRRLWITLG